MKWLLFLFLCFSIILCLTRAQNCDFYQDMAIGQEYYIYNKEYPNLYGANTACRWQARAPANSRIYLSCNPVQIPQSNQCSEDKLAISLTGNANFNDAKNYCGQGTLSLMSTGNALTVGLFSTSNTSGGKFVCTLTAIQGDNPTTQQPPPDTCDCGLRPRTRIVNGDDAQPNEFPYMVAFRDITRTIVEESQFCGGSIISKRYVVTAAHCFTNRQVSNIRVIAGAHDITNNVDTGRRQVFSIEGVQIHENYNAETVQNDIALVRLAANVFFTTYVGPVCLPFSISNRNFLGETVTATGWGQLDFSEGNARILQKVQLGITQCYGKIPVNYNNICAFGDGKDTCIADSGGPLLYNDPNHNRMFLVGLVSYGEGCGGDDPSINTRVTQYLNWIMQIGRAHV